MGINARLANRPDTMQHQPQPHSPLNWPAFSHGLKNPSASTSRHKRSNKKLLERATKIVMMVAEVDRMAALESVMRVLGVGHLDGRALRALQAKHGEAVDPSIHFSSQDLQLCIDRGSALRRVVPAAVLLATGRCAEVGEARETLEFWQDPSNGGRTLRDIVKG